MLLDLSLREAPDRGVATSPVFQKGGGLRVSPSALWLVY